jgi:hypothetical protein
MSLKSENDQYWLYYQSFGLEYLILWNLYLIGGMENTHLKRCTEFDSAL